MSISPSRSNNTSPSSLETDFEVYLRPKLFEESTAQSSIVENLRIFIQAANQPGEALDQALSTGPPGLAYPLLRFARDSGLRIVSIIMMPRHCKKLLSAAQELSASRQIPKACPNLRGVHAELRELQIVC